MTRLIKTSRTMDTGWIPRSAGRMQRMEINFFSQLESRIEYLAASGKDIIRLDVGSPDMPPAEHILQALAQAASAADAHGYQSSRGIHSLRHAWAGMYQQAFGVEVDPEDEVLPLMGSKEGIFHLVQACIEPGDIVLGPDPGYMTYIRASLFAGGEYYPLPLLTEKNYLPDLEAIPPGILARARLLWINYPHNPTAAIASLEFLARAVDFGREHHLLVCHDAAYTQVTYDGYHAPSLLSIPGAKQVAVEFNSLSKSHNMAGWRVGAALGNPQALQLLQRVKSHVDSGHFLPIMEAAVAAMTGDQTWLAQRNTIYQQRRDVVTSALQAMGLTCAVPRGSLYVWFSIPSSWSSLEFASFLLDESAVSMTPGTVFGRNGEGYLRISITQPVERITQAMQRLHKVIGGL